ncbi:MAG: DUF3515 domain-containing protein [Actinomycetota bacterium]|nr:DUF3515 domain-containing protein [Actinomycetota bacterium]
MHRRPHLTATLAGALLLTLAVGCSDQVTAKLPAGADDPACTQLGAALPKTLLKQDRRATDPSSPALAAWGDPAIILRCGVETPGPTTDQCTTVNGIDWVARPLTDGYDFTTYGRTPAIQVLVPKHYAPETFALTGLASAVAAIPQGEHRCS